MKKLSELSNDTVLLVGDTVMDKEDFLFDRKFCDYNDVEIFTTYAYEPRFDAHWILNRAVEDIYDGGETYEGWDENVLDSIIPHDVSNLQKVLDRILDRVGSANIIYKPQQLVEIDM